MEITDLSHEERLALVAALEAVTLSDGEVSDPEQREIGLIAGQLGDETYRALLDEADPKFPGIEELKRYLEGIQGQQARELIYGMLLEETLAQPAADHARSEFLAWLGQAWNIAVEQE